MTRKTLQLSLVLHLQEILHESVAADVIPTHQLVLGERSACARETISGNVEINAIF
jgi:hypothetical protein